MLAVFYGSYIMTENESSADQNYLNNLAFTSHLVKTSSYKTVYKNNQSITVKTTDSDFHLITLPAIGHTVATSAYDIDHTYDKNIVFTFTKDGAKHDEDRPTEVIVTSGKPSKTTTQTIEKIEFATRTYVLRYKSAKTTITLPVARMTVSYHNDPTKEKKEHAKEAINNLVKP